MDKYLYWLDNIPHVYAHSKICLLEAFGSGEEVYHAKEKHLRYILEEKKLEALIKSKNSWDVEGEFCKLQDQNIKMTVFSEWDYPKKLTNIPGKPFGLYYKGRLPENDLPAVAVVGARECSEYGRFIAAELGKSLGENKINVISGMATGIDGISQVSALEMGGTSFGVLGCGVDVCYPKSNRKLYQSLEEKGGIISEYSPGTQPLKQYFPPRNRIVSGLADVLVVIEARQKSGTSITVDMALEQGKDIFAVPGRVTDRLSDGCNRLLQDGAHVFLSPQDFILQLQQLIPEKMERLQRENFNRAEGTDRMEEENQGMDQEEILFGASSSLLDFYPRHVEVIAESLQKEYGMEHTVAEINSILIQMCIFGKAKQEGAGWFSKIGS